jgi:microcystin-dependent protein
VLQLPLSNNLIDMKSYILLLMLLACFSSGFGQSPQKFGYQTVLRDNSTSIIANAQVGIKATVRQGNPSGTAVYTETHNTTTDAGGVASLEIGIGNPVLGTFEAINWAAGPFFIQIETDPNGGTNYTLSSTEPLVSVPYALYAKNGGDGLPLATQSGQLASFNGTNWVARSLTTASSGSSVPVNNLQPSLVVIHCIALYGIFPSRSYSDPMIGQIALFGYNFAPRNWAACDGQLLAISQNTALFSLLGTMYGGNGVSTFALPDLRGRSSVNAGQGPGLSDYWQGEFSGEENTTLTIPNLPSHTHTVSFN